MDRPHIAAEALRAHRRALLVWLVALCGLVALTLAFWPTIRDDPNLQRFAENLPPALRAFAGNGDFLSPAGYLGARLFGVLVPIVFLSLAIGRASDAIAGDEERGTIALLLSSPISRRRLVLEKALAVACELVLLGFLLWVVLLVGGVIVDLEVSAGRLAAASLGADVLGLFFAVLALAVACQTGRRGVSRGVAGGGAAIAYILSVFAPLVEGLRPWRTLSPLFQTRGYEPLRHGLEVARVGIVAAATVALVVLAVAAYQRRDLTVG